jgi:hypothetical protein
MTTEVALIVAVPVGGAPSSEAGVGGFQSSKVQKEKANCGIGRLAGCRKSLLPAVKSFGRFCIMSLT